jgi:ribosome-associated protein
MSLSLSIDEQLFELCRRAAAKSDEQLWKECDVEVFTGPGPGGQHRNKTASAVRLTHRPTGIRVTATERRSQAQNREVALSRLRARLRRSSQRRAPRKKTKPTRAAKQRRLEAKQRLSWKKKERREEP